jgi:hypothetical protein
MAAFIAMTSWRGQFTDDYFAQPTPDPAIFGLPTEDDGSRDDPLLSDRSWAISSHRPDVDALAAAPTRVVIAVGEESLGTFTGRTAVATAELLGQQATVFPSHHGGFPGGEFGYAGPRTERPVPAGIRYTDHNRHDEHTRDTQTIAVGPGQSWELPPLAGDPVRYIHPSPERVADPHRCRTLSRYRGRRRGRT